MNNTICFRIAAALGFLAVALGAFGAHSLRETLTENGLSSAWDKAALYHLTHALVLLLLATRDPVPILAWILFCCGIVIFSGSLYLLAFTGIRWLGMITPIGGLSLLAGWLALAIKH